MYNQGYPPAQGNYPPPGGYPPAGAYPPQTGAYPPVGAYPPQTGAYPPVGAYPPQAPYGREPVYRQITVGRGIDMQEYDSIVGCIRQSYLKGVQPMANEAAENIRRTIGGDWFVFISDVGIEDYDFSLTRVRGGDFIAFSLDNKKFQVCRIR